MNLMTNGAQFHLLLNHLPVILPLIATPILLIGLMLKSPIVQKVGLWLLVVSAVATIPAYLTGEPAEAVVKNYPNVSRLGIGDHAEAAYTALIWSGIVGVLSLGLLVIFGLGKTISKYAWIMLLLISLTSFALAARTAHLGGQIRHEEIQTESQRLQL